MTCDCFDMTLFLPTTTITTPCLMANRNQPFKHMFAGYQSAAV